MIVSVYKNFAAKVTDRNIMEIFNEVKSGTYKTQILAIRYAYEKGQ